MSSLTNVMTSDGFIRNNTSLLHLLVLQQPTIEWGAREYYMRVVYIVYPIRVILYAKTKAPSVIGHLIL
jgi:hypothetical protein